MAGDNSEQMHYLQPSDPGCDEETSEPSDIADNGSRLMSAFERLRAKLAVWLEREFGGGPPCPEDVVQQTFAKLAERSDLDAIDNLEAYAWATAINLVRREKRAQRIANAYVDDRRHGIWGNEQDDFDPERLLRAREELRIVAEALQAMPERRRTIFMACRFDGLSQEEAGKRAGVSRNAAARHIAIATQMIADALSASEDRVNDRGEP
ncbi:MAG: sigma-70 family RNA polymerase sigma factor [Pseudomonadota bacterium]